jgi:hypothetical protein
MFLLTKLCWAYIQQIETFILRATRPSKIVCLEESRLIKLEIQY